jgi:hypothetical protein
MEELAPGFDKLTTGAIDGAVKQAQRQDLEKRADESIQLKKIKETKDPKPKSIKTMKEGLAMAKDVQGEMVKRDKDLNARKEKARRKCTKFKNHPLFQAQLKLVGLPPVAASCEEWEACLETIKTELGSQKAVENLWDYMAWICGGLEGLSKAYPDIFGGVNLSNPISLGNVMKDPQVHKRMEQEAAELAILYDEWLSSRAEARFVKGMLAVVKDVAMLNAQHSNARVSAEELGRKAAV